MPQALPFGKALHTGKTLIAVVGALWWLAVICFAFGRPTTAQPPASSRMLFVRGYIAAAVGGNADNVGPAARVPAHDVFLPGVSVFLKPELTGGTETAPVKTDLSGRFTVWVKTPGRYRVCWKADGFIPDCSHDIFSLSNAPLNVGTLRISPDRSGGTTVVFGQVKMKDGTPPRLLEPLANVNAFARVALLDGGGNQLQEVYVNNFTEYLLPRVPVRQPIALRARIEGGSGEQRILPQANLDRGPFHPVNLVVANTPPNVEPLVATDASGRRVRVAKPGAKLQLHARATDDDGDAIQFRWLAAAGSGTLSATNTPSLSWTLPNQPGRYTVHVIAYDRKGGYAQSALSMPSDNRGVAFSGKVDATDVSAVAGAEVEVNGQTAITGVEGVFQLYVKDANRFVLNIRKRGYALVSRIYDDGVMGGRWTMTRATVTSVDPTRDNEITDQRDPRNCTGPPSGGLNWHDYAALAQPEWQDGKGHVVGPLGRLQVPLPSERPRDRDCGPGVRVRIPANSLRDARGRAPVGNVDVSVSTVDLMSPEQMPGDYSVKLSNGDMRVMQSYGAGIIEITQGAARYNLKPGATASVTIPVDPSQVTAGGTLPPTIPLLFYDERQGVWFQDGQATLTGNAYVATVKHFSAINTDTIKTDQSCVRVLSPTLPPTYNLEITIPMGPGAAPKVLTRLIDNTSPSEHVIYNLPSNVNIVLVPIRLTDNTPIGTFVVNTGGHQNPTSPNLPGGPPYVACSTVVTLHDRAVPAEPLSGEFLQGLYSFEATNLTELNPADPTQNALKNALDQASDNYYKQIDPRGKRLTLDQFKQFNGFPAGEIHGVYGNSADLGFGRDMHCIRNGTEVAAYVTNYGDITTSDQDDALAAATGTTVNLSHLVATVAMEYSRIEDPLPPGAPPNSPLVYSDPERVVKFYVYDAAGNLLRSANLDGLGERPVPQLCMVCHGGEYPGGSVIGGAPPFGSRDDVKLNAMFLPFDLHGFTFAPAPFDKATQQPAFKLMNETIVKDSPPNPVIADIIAKMYANSPTMDESFVVAGWNALPSQQVMYRDVVARVCRTCHVTNAVPDLRFDQASQMISTRLGSIENRVCAQLVMPHAKRAHDLFWTSVGPHMPAELQVFGDTFKSGLNGWNGTLCGEFTAGGPTPATFFTGTIQPIFNLRCTGCHVGGSSAPAGLDLQAGVSYGNLVNVPSTELPTMMRIKPNDTAHSYLFHKIQGTQGMVGGSGAQMPLFASPLPAAEINNIQTWINTGATP